MPHETTTFICALLIAVILATARLAAQQVADTLYRANVSSPAYNDGTGPTVFIDEGHHNFHTISGRYLAFARLLQKDGYVVKPHREAIRLFDNSWIPEYI